MIPWLVGLCGALLAPAPVTLEVRAAPVPEVVKQIAEATGADLRVAATLAEQRIGVRFDAVPLDTVKAKLAEALDAEWEAEGPGLRLVPNPLTGDDDGPFKEMIRAYFERMPAPTPFTRQDAEKLVRDALTARDEMGNSYDWPRVQALDARTPDARRSREILRALGPRALSELEEGRPTVFSTAPTRMQRELPPAVTKILEQAEQESSMHNEVLDRLAPSGSESGGYSLRALHPSGRGLPFASGLPPGRETGTVLVALQRTDWGVLMRLSTYDLEGNIIDSSTEHITGSWSRQIEPATLLEPNGAVYQPSETARSFAAVAAGLETGNPNEAPPATAEDRARVETVLKDLVKHDPLAWGFGDLWLQAVKAYGLNSVAVFPDQLANMGLWGLGGSTELGAIVNEIGRGSGDSLEHKDGWLTFRRGAGLGIPLTPFPRSAISAFVRASLAAGGPRLDPLADLAAVSPSENEFRTFLMWPRLLWPTLQSHMAISGDLMVLRLYGRLDPDTRRRARGPEGVTVRYGQLNRRAQPIVDDILFRMDHGSGLTNNAPDFETDYFYRGGWGNLATEPTVALAEGVPPRATLMFRVRDRGVIYARRPARGSGYWDGPEAVSPEQIARNLTMVEAPWFDASDTRYPVVPYDRFATGTLEQLDMLGTFGEGLFLSSRFQLPALPPEDEWVGFDGLPEEVRKQVEEQVEQVRKQYKEMRESGRTFGRPRGGRPPVP